jgi:hypothetical protein
MSASAAPPTAAPQTAAGFPAWAERALSACILVLMFALTWRTWPDPLVDFGREACVPWALMSGKNLYTDIACHNGPLSPYVNSLWFMLFGADLRALFLGNALVLLGTLWLIRRFALAMAGRGGALAASAGFLVLSAFASLTGIGNYNWLAPYSHEMTHGVFLALAAAAVLARRPGLGAGLAAGALAGLAFMTKAETALAALFGLVLQLLFLLSAERRGRAAPGTAKKAAAGTAGGFLLVLGVAWLLLLLIRDMPPAQAWYAVLGAWQYVFGHGNLDAPFFKWCLGLDQPLRNLGSLALVFAAQAGILILPAWLDMRLAARAAGRPGVWRILAATAGFAAALAWPAAASWAVFFVSLPAWVLLCAGWFFLPGTKNHCVDTSPVIMPLHPLPQWPCHAVGVAGCALGLLLKMPLNARVYHYGFGLAVPALVLLVCMAAGPAAQLLRRRPGGGIVFAGFLAGAWAAVLLAHLGMTVKHVQAKTYLVGAGRNAFFADSRGAKVQKALLAIDEIVPADASLAVVPEGEMLNFLSRRHSPLRVRNWNPHQIVIVGEEQMLADLQANPPDFIVLADSDYSDYGSARFGRDYGAGLWAWIQGHYRPEAILAPPLQAGVEMPVGLLRHAPEPSPETEGTQRD